MSADSNREKQNGSSKDSSLLERARSGCELALGELLEFYRPYFLKIAEDTVASDLRPKLSPSDLVQGTLVLAAKNFEQFQGKNEDDLRPWMITIFRNHLLDGIRQFRYSEKRKVEREQGVSPTMMGDASSPSELAVANEEVDRLLIGIANLPEQSRNIVRMRYLEDLSYAEIAEKLDCSPDKARRVWLKAIDELGKELES